MKCNICGKELRQEFGIIKEDYLFIRKNWGYFSEKDGQTHEFCLCENCYDKWIQSFKISVEAKDTIEMI